MTLYAVLTASVQVPEEGIDMPQIEEDLIEAISAVRERRLLHELIEIRDIPDVRGG